MHDSGQSNAFLRARAVQADGTQARDLDLALLWRELVNSECRVIDSFHSAERCYVVVEQREKIAEKVRAVQAGKIRLLEAILLESAQKNLAIDLGLPASTVAGALKQCLEQLGLPCTTSRISPLLVGAAYASHSDANRCWGRVSQLRGADFSYRVVSVARPESALVRRLTPAQYEVVRLLIEGKSHAEIATARRRSTRTIANQIGAAFRKLGVSGRSELIRSLIVQSAGTASDRASAQSSEASWSRGTPIIVRRYRPRTRRVLRAS